MGCQFTYGTAGATGGGFSAQSGSLQSTYEDRLAEPRWDMQARSPKTWKDRFQWSSKWSFGCRTEGGNGAGQDGSAMIGRDILAGDLFEPYSCDGDGCQTMSFITGTAYDSTGATPIADAIIQCFRTSDDAYGGQSVSRSDGSFAVPSRFPGVAHYIVAYKSGSPDIAGTTVNTLIPV